MVISTFPQYCLINPSLLHHIVSSIPRTHGHLLSGGKSSEKMKDHSLITSSILFLPANYDKGKIINKEKGPDFLDVADCALTSLNLATTVSMVALKSPEGKIGASRRKVFLLPLHDQCCRHWNGLHRGLNLWCGTVQQLPQQTIPVPGPSPWAGQPGMPANLPLYAGHHQPDLPQHIPYQQATRWSGTALSARL